jgi:hypothetical protein
MKRLFVGIGAVALGIACGGATQSDVFGGSTSSSGGSSSGGSCSSSGGGGKTLEGITTCEKPGQCELGGKGCCGRSCGQSGETIAIRRGEAETLRQLTCTQKEPVACPACAPAPDPNTQAFCESGKCVVVDIPTHAISDCSSNGECELAWGECCHPCGTPDLSMITAVRKGGRAELRAQLCSGTEACADCVERFPATYQAACDRPSGHCVVVQR